MFGYYVNLALRNVRRSRGLTALMVLAIGMGIGACMTTMTVLRLLSGDPLPGRSSTLFYPQVDPTPPERGVLPTQLTYLDAMNLWRAGKADRQAIMVGSTVKVRSVEAATHPVGLSTLATTADFFAMFAVPFVQGGPWAAHDDLAKARVAVISQSTSWRLFHGGHAVGQSIRLGRWDFRVIGVTADWRPVPRFYDLDGQSYGQGNEVFIPFLASRDLADLGITGISLDCFGDVTDQVHLENQPCLWLKFWVELDSSAKVAAYRRFLANYSREQQTAGRFTYAGAPRIGLPDLRAWLDQNGVVPPDARLKTWLALGFLLVCLMNATGLLLVKFLRRGAEISVRRALGASRRQIFLQCLVESGGIGLAGGGLGLLLVFAGLWGVRHTSVDYADLAHADMPMLLATLAVSVASGLLAGWLPAWRACRVAPALHLKTL